MQFQIVIPLSLNHYLIKDDEDIFVFLSETWLFLIVGYIYIYNWFWNLCCIDNEGNCQNLKQFKIENLIKCHSNKGLKACINSLDGKAIDFFFISLFFLLFLQNTKVHNPTFNKISCKFVRSIFEIENSKKSGL